MTAIDATLSASGSLVIRYTEEGGAQQTVSVPKPPAADVTSQVRIVGTGLAYNRFTQIFAGTITVTNSSATVLKSPLRLRFENISPQIDVLTEGTSGTAESDYVPYLSSERDLGPGETVTFPVRFMTINNAPISYTPKVYTGYF